MLSNGFTKAPTRRAQRYGARSEWDASQIA